jgi:hypothetical protein
VRRRGGDRLEGIVEKKKKFGLPYGIFSSQNDAESWGLLAALRWIDAGKPDTEALVASLLFLAPSLIPSAIHRQAPFGISCNNQDRGQNADYVFRSRLLRSSSSISKVDAAH